MVGANSCGRAYFPIELKTKSRAERSKGQEKNNVQLVALTEKSTLDANNAPYKRKVIVANDLTQAAKLIPSEQAIVERFPKNNDPGPYIIGIGDVLSVSEILATDPSVPTFVTRQIAISDEGFINVYGLGSLQASGLTQSELQDKIYQKLLEVGRPRTMELSLSEFNSKRIFLNGDGISSNVIKYTNYPIFLEDVVATSGIKQEAGFDYKILLMRNEQEYTFSFINLMKSKGPRVRLFPDDRIFINAVNYSLETVLVVGETGAQRAVPITSIQRPTLSDTIFSGSVLRSGSSDFSQIYVLRQIEKNFKAYHLDITDPTRIKLAKKFEMRPDDIVFVAAQPLTLYSRTLQQILGSVGLTLQGRDTLRSELGN